MARGKLKLFEKRKFILSVGDEGAILTLMNGRNLEQRYYIDGPGSAELTSILNEEPGIPIYLLVDVLDQAYIQHALPPVSSLSIGQLVKRRLQKDFADEEIKAARKLYRSKDGRKDWYYSFISVHNAPPFSDWLEVLLEAENPFKGIYLLPIETENLVKKLNIALSDKKRKKTPEWQILISHNKVGGFRQIVYKDGKVLFTRIAQPIGGNAPDVIAGNIEQETLNTIEYIRRLGFDNDEKLDIFIISSRAVKMALETNALRARRIIILTPDETATKLGLRNIAEKTDRFGDVVIAASFANSKPVMRLSSVYSKKIEQMYAFNMALNTTAGILVPLFLFLSFSALGEIFSLGDEIELAQKEQSDARTRLNEAQSRRNELPENSAEVVEVTRVYDTLRTDAKQPLQFTKKLAEIKTSQFAVETIEISTEDVNNEGSIIDAKIKILFLNPSRNLDRLLEDLDSFTEIVKRQFADYAVEFSGLPKESDNLSLDSTKQGVDRPLEIMISGPKELLDKVPGRSRR